MRVHQAALRKRTLECERQSLIVRPSWPLASRRSGREHMAVRATNPLSARRSCAVCAGMRAAAVCMAKTCARSLLHSRSAQTGQVDWPHNQQACGPSCTHTALTTPASVSTSTVSSRRRAFACQSSAHIVTSNWSSDVRTLPIVIASLEHCELVSVTRDTADTQATQVTADKVVRRRAHQLLAVCVSSYANVQRIASRQSPQDEQTRSNTNTLTNTNIHKMDGTSKVSPTQ